MADDKWMLDDGIYYPISGDVVLHTALGRGIWELVKDPNPRSARLGLRKLSDEFTFDFKIYETGGKEAIQRVYDLWNNEEYQDSEKNLGIIFNGLKGTGKTIAAKLLCNKIGLPVIIVNQSFEGGILEFIPRLAFEAVILIDEAEKTFSEKDDAHYLLKLIDGVYNRTRKLYILTTNKLHINENLLGRPGRIRYIQEFTNLPKEAVEEYLDDNLKDKSKKDEVHEIIDVLEISTIDILKSIVEEFNIFGNIGGDHGMMNIPRSNYVYDAIKFYGYNEEDLEKVREIIRKNKPADISIGDWFTGKKTSGVTNKDIVYENPVKKEEKENTETETTSATDLFEDSEKDRTAYTVRITSKYSEIGKHTETNQGQVLTDPTKDGFVLIKDHWGDDVNLYLILKQKKTISVYNNYNLI